MNWSGWVFVAAFGIAATFFIRYVRVSLSLSSVFLGALLLFHGPAYMYYSRVWGPDTVFYDQILAAAPGQPVLQTLDLALAITLICVCLGIRLVDHFYGVTAARVLDATRRWASSPVVVSPEEARRLRIALVISCIFLVPFVFLDSQISKVWEFFGTDMTTAEKIAFRRDEGGSGFYVYNLLLSTAICYVLFAAIAGWCLMRRRWAWLTMAVAALVLLGKFATVSKAPVVVLLLQCAVVVLMTRSLRLPLRALGALGALAAAGFTAMTFVALPELDGLPVVLEFVFYRVFMVVNEGLLEYFSAIPHVIDFSWGAQASWLAALFQDAPSPPTYLLVGAVHRDFMGSTTTVMFMGDAWADFAWAGVILASVAAGMVVRMLDVKLIVQRGRSVGTIAGLALGQYGVFTALNTSLQTAMVTGGLLFVLPLVSAISKRAQPSSGIVPSAT